MSFWSDFGRGITAHYSALQFVAKHNLWMYFLVPMIISVLLLLFGFFSIWSLGDIIRDYFLDLVTPYSKDVGGFGGKILGFLTGFIGVIIGFVFRIIFFLLIMKIMRYVILIIISPILALASERVDEIITGKKYPFEFKQFLHDIGRGITVSLRNMCLETLIFVATLFVCWIPLLNFLIVPFLMLVGWYFLGFNMMDYSYERRRMRIGAGRDFTRKHKGLAMGNGFIYSVLLYIPLIGFTFAPVLSVIAATLATLEKVDEKNSATISEF